MYLYAFPLRSLKHSARLVKQGNAWWWPTLLKLDCPNEHIETVNPMQFQKKKTIITTWYECIISRRFKPMVNPKEWASLGVDLSMLFPLKLASLWSTSSMPRCERYCDSTLSFRFVVGNRTRIIPFWDVIDTCCIYAGMLDIFVFFTLQEGKRWALVAGSQSQNRLCSAPSDRHRTSRIYCIRKFTL
jgi:hypothetical protein